MKPLNLVGTKFNKLTVIRRSGHRKLQVLWLCQCDCGNSFEATTRGLRSGNNKSCGCLKHRFGLDNPTAIHGHCPKRGLRTPEWRAFHNARQRCINPHNISYKYYGGRGIEFRYTTFQEFFADVGLRPTPLHTLDRRENNGHYEKGNCRWVTSDIQVQNRCIRKITEFSDDEIRQEYARRNL
jgi:hypothetical protein